MSKLTGRGARFGSLALAGLAVWGLGCGPAGTRPPAEVEAGPAALATEVEAAFEAFLEAWEQEELGAAVGAFTPDAVVFDPLPPGRFEGIDAIRAWTADAFDALEGISIAVEGLRIQTAGPVAWLTARYLFAAQRGGEPTQEEGNLSMVWVRQPDGSYRASLFHASRLPEVLGPGR